MLKFLIKYIKASTVEFYHLEHLYNKFLKIKNIFLKIIEGSIDISFWFKKGEFYITNLFTGNENIKIEFNSFVLNKQSLKAKTFTLKIAK